MTVPHITIEQVAAMYPHVDKSDHCGILGKENSQIDAYNKANEQPLITAEEARKLVEAGGAADFQLNNGKWQPCHESCAYLERGGIPESAIKYRAIKQPEPEKSTNFEYDGHKNYSNTEPVEPKICTIKNLDTGIISTMTREAAKKLQAELGDTVEWVSPQGLVINDSLNHPFGFSCDGIYTYKLRGTVKLAIDDEPAKMLTPAQCEVERLVRIDTHDLQSLGGIFKSWTKIGDAHWLPLDASDHRDYQVQYRLILKQPKPWTGSREDVIALLKELGFLNEDDLV